MKHKQVIVVSVMLLMCVFAYTAHGYGVGDIAFAHEGGTSLCGEHAGGKTCWGETDHILVETKEDVEGYTRARFEGLFGAVKCDTGKQYGIGTSSANTEDNKSPNCCTDNWNLYTGHTYYGSDLIDARSSANEIEYKMNVETQEVIRLK